MRLNVELRDFILANFVEPERGIVADILSMLPEPKHLAIRPDGYHVSASVSDEVLVVTRVAVGFGWPMNRVLWAKP